MPTSFHLSKLEELAIELKHGNSMQAVISPDTGDSKKYYPAQKAQEELIKLALEFVATRSIGGGYPRLMLNLTQRADKTIFDGNKRIKILRSTIQKRIRRYTIEVYFEFDQNGIINNIYLRNQQTGMTRKVDFIVNGVPPKNMMKAQRS